MAAEGAERIDCARVEERDLASRYVAGRLDPDEARSFEAHYFECDRCWARVERATEIRAAFAAEASEGRGGPGGEAEERPDPTDRPDAAPPARRRPSRWLRWGVPAAAAALLVGLIVRTAGDGSGPRPAGETLRGPDATVSVSSTLRADSVVASWSPVADADLYAVGLHAADGSLILTREVSDTTVSVATDRLPPEGEAYWSVEALDALREVVGRSRLVPVQR